MRKKSISIILSFLLILCFGFYGCNSAKDNKFIKENTNLYDYSLNKTDRINIHGWNLPVLEKDEVNGYDTENNAAIVKDFTDAGMNILHLTGKNIWKYNFSEDSCNEYTELMDYLNSKGVQSTVFGYNAVNIENNDLLTNMPDFTASNGFYSLLAWDEPETKSMTRLGLIANKFESIYGKNATFYINLLPSYASIFSTGGYDEYFEAYGDIVLSKLSGKKIISVDSYPLKDDKSIMQNYLYDLAMIRHYSNVYDAEAHIAMQCCTTGGLKNRAPAKSELSMMANTALALGMESLSWYTYSDHQEEGEKQPVSPTANDGTKREVYNSLKQVNANINSFGYVYKCFEWKGVLLDGTSQAGAMSLIKRNRQLSKLVYLANETGTLSSITADNDYVIGYMKDKNNNDGFMIANYGSLKDNHSLKLTLDFGDNNKAQIYKNGEMQIATLNSGVLELSFDYGEGAFVIPYYEG